MSHPDGVCPWCGYGGGHAPDCHVVKLEQERKAASLRQAHRLVEIATDFEGALKKLPPKEAQKYRDEQEAVADCRRRAAQSRRLNEMRLD
jgi:hypothetical protein